MKRIVLLLVAIFLVRFFAAGQGPEFSVRGGLNVTDFRGASWDAFTDLTDFSADLASLEDRAGFNIGLYSIIPLNHAVSVETGLAYDQKGMGFAVRPWEGSFLNPSLKATLKLDYLTAPVNLIVKTVGGLSITGGGGVSRLIDSRMKVKGSILGIGLGEDFKINQTFNEWDFNIRGGLMYDFGNGFHVKTEYQHGLTRIYENLIGIDAFNKGFAVSAGYKF